MSESGIKTAIHKMRKPTYKFLNSKQKRIIKLREDYLNAEHFLYGAYGFFKTAPRLSNKQIDWDIIDRKQMITFENANKTIEKYNKISENEIMDALKIFEQTQFKAGSSY